MYSMYDGVAFPFYISAYLYSTYRVHVQVSGSSGLSGTFSLRIRGLGGTVGSKVAVASVVMFGQSSPWSSAVNNGNEHVHAPAQMANEGDASRQPPTHGSSL